VLLYDAPLQDQALLQALDEAMEAHRSPRHP